MTDSTSFPFTEIATPDVERLIPPTQLDGSAEIEYRGETDRTYRVHLDSHGTVLLAKNRLSAEAATSIQNRSLIWAERLLLASLIGLAFAGLVALVFAPAAIALSIVSLRTGSTADRRTALITALLAMIVLAIAAPLAVLFFFHN